MTTTTFYQPPPTLLAKLLRMQWLLVAVLCLLATIGLAALYSVAGGAWAPWAERHAVRFLAGLALLLAIGLVPIWLWRALAYPAYAVALVLLFLVPVLGRHWGHDAGSRAAA